VLEKLTSAEAFVCRLQNALIYLIANNPLFNDENAANFIQQLREEAPRAAVEILDDEQNLNSSSSSSSSNTNESPPVALAPDDDNGLEEFMMVRDDGITPCLEDIQQHIDVVHDKAKEHATSDNRKNIDALVCFSTILGMHHAIAWKNFNN